MEKYNKLWRLFFAIGLIAIAVQQIILASFVPMMIPQLPPWLPGHLAWVYIFSIALIASCVLIVLEIKARSVSLILGGIFLLLVVIFQIPGQFSGPFNLASWTTPFKELTFSGGALVVAGSFPPGNNASGLVKLLEKLIPLGKYFMAVTMALFGFMHFIYPGFVSTLVPNWIPWHLFWTYFAGIALMAAGIGIILNIMRSLASILLGIMLFLWVIMLHIPLAIADPVANEWTSVFEALAFSGIALLIADKQRILHN